MDPVKAASRMDTDQIVGVGEIRAWLELLAVCAWQGAGYRRTKNPRIWSLHDLAVIAPTATSHDTLDAQLDGAVLRAPTVGVFEPTVPEGAAVQPGRVLGVLERAGHRLAVLAPTGTSGVVRSPVRGWCEAGAPLCELGAGGAGLEPPSPVSDPDVPEGVTVLRAETDGTFYTCPEPGSPPFVSAGSQVRARDTLGLVEVMKTFSPIRAERDGTVERVLVGDGEPVETGQALVWMREG